MLDGKTPWLSKKYQRGRIKNEIDKEIETSLSDSFIGFNPAFT